MKLIKNIFWNTEQARLRAAYRILIQLIIFFILRSYAVEERM